MTSEKRKTIIEKERETPIIAEVDVLVVGGGPAGVGAALAAARNGAKTMLIERWGFLGGMWTAGLVNPLFDYKNKGGIIAELVSRLKARGAWKSHRFLNTFDPETMKFILDQMMEESGVTVLFYTLAVDVIVKDNQIKGVIIENKSGRQAILAKIVIDCTGDGDIAAKAGAPYEKGRREDGLMQPMTLMFRLSNVTFHQEKWDQLYELMKEAVKRGVKYPWRTPSAWIIHLPNKGDAVVQLTHIFKVDGTDAWDLTKAVIEGRKIVMDTVKLFKNIPELESVALIDSAVSIGIRETRRIIGEYVLTLEDMIKGRKFDDGVLTCTFGIDIHEPDPKNVPPLPEDLVSQKYPTIKPYQIPYRCLVPLKIDNLLVAGRCISGSHEAHASYRVTGDCIAMGQAAGTAAALCVKNGVTPRELDASLLRHTLKEQGVAIDY